jgi:5-methyltetrahydrofolate--homocysteine methyltransferase
MTTISDLLKSKKPILLDGAMGTMLFEAGLETGDPPEEWNIKQPEKVRKIHQAYIRAGSQIILTNSFGGTSIRLALHSLDHQVSEFNKAAARIARQEADQADSTVFVAGSIGPSGEIMEPAGTLNFQEAQEAFKEQASSLHEGGVDLFWIETMSDIEEVKAAVVGIREVSDLPIAATMSFDTHGHTMMGVAPEQAVKDLGDLDLIAIGANCGTGSNELIEVIQKMEQANPDAVLIAKANAGIPQVIGTEVVYNGSPEVMADYARDVFRAGAMLIGGCCGNKPDHVAAMARALSELT